MQKAERKMTAMIAERMKRKEAETSKTWTKMMMMTTMMTNEHLNTAT